ncbi:MAG: Rne/Rng family ribonuclease [Candidatus Sericytochromatia bacterium]|nr:Rne/Rng family ribonuclease [Candidatus Sericytochromatia bacterium]
MISEANDLAVVFENGRASEFFLRHGDQLVGDIIWGQVDAVVPGIEAAFVNIGQDRNGFIHVADLPSMQTPRKTAPPKKPTIKVRDRILVQIAKAPTGTKGARLTGRITIPGRFLVLVPHDNRVSISRRITDGYERERLRELTLRLKDPGHGLIVRTEAIGRSEEELRQDIEELIEIWADILHQVQIVEPPALLHRDSDLIHRVLRDALTGDVNRIVVDTHTGYHKAREILQGWMPEVADQVELHEGAQSIMERYKISEELDAAISPKVWLPSGGYLILEHTEALTVIDVNSGRLTQSKSLAETVLRTNIEAAEEIARQLRLRDIGGIIVIDFISMDEHRDRQKVFQAFLESLKQDKSRPQVTNFSEHGLIEVSRRRQGQNLLEQLTLPCDLCGGTGRKKASHLLSENPVHQAVRVGRIEEEAAEILEELEVAEEELGLELLDGSPEGDGEGSGDPARRRRRRRRRGRGRGGAETELGPILTEPGDAIALEEGLFAEEAFVAVEPSRAPRPRNDFGRRETRQVREVAVSDDFGMVEEVDLFGDQRPGSSPAGARSRERGGRDRGGRDRFGGRERFGDRGRPGRDRFAGRDDRGGGAGGLDGALMGPRVAAAEPTGTLHVTAPGPRVRRVERRSDTAVAATSPATETPTVKPTLPVPAAAAVRSPAPTDVQEAPKAVAEERRRPAKPLPVPEELSQTAVPGVFVLKKKAAGRPSLDSLLGDAPETSQSEVKPAKAPAKRTVKKSTTAAVMENSAALPSDETLAVAKKKPVRKAATTSKETTATEATEKKASTPKKTTVRKSAQNTEAAAALPEEPKKAPAKKVAAAKGKSTESDVAAVKKTVVRKAAVKTSK